MLKDRIFSAAILLLIFLASYLSDNPTYFLFLNFVASGILFYELAKILKLKSLSLAIYWILSFTPVIFFYLLVALNKGFVGEFLVNFSIFMSFVSVIFWFTLAPIDIVYKKISSNAKLKIFYGYFMIAPMSILTSYIFIHEKNALLLIFLMIWVSDIGAYFFGKRFGKNKLAKNISPGKTIEGALGGLISNIIIAFLLSYFGFGDLLFLLIFATVVTCLSICGDIYQSFLKRQAKVKDSGTILPGHGGLFDRLDSFCPTIPLSFLILFYYVSYLV